MRILLTGATGYIGSAVLEVLRDRGHDVVAVVRSEGSAAKVVMSGANAVVHELADADWLAGQLAEVDGAIHAAARKDGTSDQLDDAVVDAVIRAFGGTDKPFVLTGGIWSWPAGDDITEETSTDPVEISAWRIDDQERLLASDVTAAVLSPGIVHGRGGGLVGKIASAPRDAEGRLTLIGSGEQHWPWVHVEDLAELYVAVLERRGTGHVIGVADDNVTVTAVAEALLAADGTPGRVVAESEDAARERLGTAFADALLLDQQAHGAHAREAFDWIPSRPTILDEVGAS